MKNHLPAIKLAPLWNTFLVFGLFSLSSCGGGGDDFQKQLPALNGMSGNLTKEHAQAIAGMFERDGLQGLNADDSLPMKLKSAGDLEDRVEGYDQSCELLSQSGTLEDQDSDGVPANFKTEYQCSECGLSGIPCRRTASAKDFNDNDWRAGHLSEFYQIYSDGTWTSF